MTLEEELIRGERAARIIENEIYIESWKSVRDGIIRAWESAPIRDKEGQNELKLMLKLLNDVRKNIENVMQTGSLAKIQIERENMFTSRFNRFR